MKKSLIVACCILFPIIGAGSSIAQERVIIHPAEGSIKLDGIPDEPVWATLEPLRMVSLNPAAGQVPFQETEVRITYTRKDLYVAAWLHDKEPEKIRATSKIRDDFDLTNDWFGICLDSYLDKENALLFATTPSGLRADAQIYNDGQGDFPMLGAWNTVWCRNGIASRSCPTNGDSGAGQNPHSTPWSNSQGSNRSTRSISPPT